MKHRVTVEYLGRVSYIIDDPDPEEARRKGLLAFMSEDEIDGEVLRTSAEVVSDDTPDGSVMEMFNKEEGRQ